MIEINKSAFFISVDGENEARTFTVIRGKIVGHTFNQNKDVVAHVVGVAGWNQPIVLSLQNTYKNKQEVMDALDKIMNNTNDSE